MIWGSTNRAQMLCCLILFAGGAACGALFDLFLALGAKAKSHIVSAVCDGICVLLCAVLLLWLWYRADRIYLHILPPIFAVFGAVIWHFGAGYYVRLCFAKYKSTTSCSLTQKSKKL